MRRPLKVIVCLVTMAAFLVNTVSYELAWAASSGAMSGTPTSDRKVSIPEQRASFEAATFRLPESLGRVQHRYSTGRVARPVIHIQDAHCNYDCQKKIAEIIAYVKEEYGASVINLEGGAGKYDLSVFTDIEDKRIRTQVADHFVRKGILNGAEYFAAINPGAVTLWGVEDTGLYLDNLNAYRTTLDFKDEADGYVLELERVLGLLKGRIYSSALLEFDEHYSRYKEGTLDLKGYLTYLFERGRKSGVEIKEFTYLPVLKEMLEEEGDMDFERADRERQRLMDELSRRLSRTSWERLLRKAVEFGSHDIRRAEFYACLARKAALVNVDLADLSALRGYMAYVARYDTFEHLQTIEEMAVLETAIKESLYENDKQRELSMLSENLGILRKLFDIRLAREDHAYYLENEKGFSVDRYLSFIEKKAPLIGAKARVDGGVGKLDRYRKRTFKFYEYVFKRDEVFLRNLKTDETSASVPVVLVTGGFHTENLAELFREKGISYVSIMPDFRSGEDSGSPYFELLSGKHEATLRALLPGVMTLALFSYFSEGSAHVKGPHARTMQILPRIEAVWRKGRKTVNIGGLTYHIGEEGVPDGAERLRGIYVGGETVSILPAESDAWEGHFSSVVLEEQPSENPYQSPALYDDRDQETEMARYERKLLDELVNTVREVQKVVKRITGEDEPLQTEFEGLLAYLGSRRDGAKIKETGLVQNTLEAKILLTRSQEQILASLEGLLDTNFHYQKISDGFEALRILDNMVYFLDLVAGLEAALEASHDASLPGESQEKIDELLEKARVAVEEPGPGIATRIGITIFAALVGTLFSFRYGPWGVVAALAITVLMNLVARKVHSPARGRAFFQEGRTAAAWPGQRIETGVLLRARALAKKRAREAIAQYREAVNFRADLALVFSGPQRTRVRDAHVNVVWKYEEDRVKILMSAYETLIRRLKPLLGPEAVLIYPFMGMDLIPSAHFSTIPISNDPRDVALGEELMKISGLKGLPGQRRDAILESYGYRPDALSRSSYQVKEEITGTRVLVMKGFYRYGELYGGKDGPEGFDSSTAHRELVSLLRHIVQEVLRSGDRILVLDAHDLEFLRDAGLLSDGVGSFTPILYQIYNPPKAMHLPDVVAVFEKNETGELEKIIAESALTEPSRAKASVLERVALTIPAVLVFAGVVAAAVAFMAGIPHPDGSAETYLRYASSVLPLGAGAVAILMDGLVLSKMFDFMRRRVNLAFFARTFPRMRGVVERYYLRRLVAAREARMQKRILERLAYMERTKGLRISKNRPGIENAAHMTIRDEHGHRRFVLDSTGTVIERYIHEKGKFVSVTFQGCDPRGEREVLITLKKRGTTRRRKKREEETRNYDIYLNGEKVPGDVTYTALPVSEKDRRYSEVDSMGVWITVKPTGETEFIRRAVYALFGKWARESGKELWIEGKYRKAHDESLSAFLDRAIEDIRHLRRSEKLTDVPGKGEDGPRGEPVADKEEARDEGYKEGDYVVGEGLIKGPPIRSIVSNEEGFKRVNVRVVGVRGETARLEMEKILAESGARDMLVFEEKELKELVGEHAGTVSGDTNAETRLIKAIKEQESFARLYDLLEENVAPAVAETMHRPFSTFLLEPHRGVCLEKGRDEGGMVFTFFQDLRRRMSRNGLNVTVRGYDVRTEGDMEEQVRTLAGSFRDLISECPEQQHYGHRLLLRLPERYQNDGDRVRVLNIIKSQLTEREARTGRPYFTEEEAQSIMQKQVRFVYFQGEITHINTSADIFKDILAMELSRYYGEGYNGDDPRPPERLVAAYKALLGRTVTNYEDLFRAAGDKDPVAYIIRQMGEGLFLEKLRAVDWRVFTEKLRAREQVLISL